MHPKRHIIYGTIFAIILFILFDDVGINEALIIWISSWLLIDLDHALRYTLKTGSINPIGFWKWSVLRGNEWNRLSETKKKKYKIPIYIFHGVEPLIIIGIFALFNQIFVFVFIGVIFHLICDLLNLYKREENLLGKVSIIYVLIHNSRDKQLSLY